MKAFGFYYVMTRRKKQIANVEVEFNILIQYRIIENTILYFKWSYSAGLTNAHFHFNYEKVLHRPGSTLRLLAAPSRAKRGDHFRVSKTRWNLNSTKWHRLQSLNRNPSSSSWRVDPFRTPIYTHAQIIYTCTQWHACRRSNRANRMEA